jgi:membrane protease YdiL (CAAX protease family)
MQPQPEVFVFFVKILLSVGSVKEYSYADYASIFMIISALAGFILFAYWAVKNKFGKGTLERAGFRANSMPYYVPFAVLLGWLAIYSLSSNLAETFTAKMPDWQQKFVTYSVFILIEVIVIVFILASAKRHFEAGLRGFGLRIEGVFGDIGAACAMFIAVWPLVLIALFLVIRIGTILEGPDFQMQRNEGLVVILENKQWSLRLLMIFFATILTPVFEELVFRGLLQSYLRDVGFSPWRSIFIASIIFSVLHPLMHLPALLILSVCMGYAYEKSGSLFRSIFIHFFFNSATIAFALLG